MLVVGLGLIIAREEGELTRLRIGWVGLDLLRGGDSCMLARHSR